MAKFLVTGGAGFIGSHLVDALLARGHKIRVLDNLSTGNRANLAAEAELVVADTTDYSAVASAVAQMDGVFHLAAVASVERGFEDWPGTHQVNQSGFINVLDVSRRVGTKPIPVVYASSAAVYGNDGDRALRESALTVPVSGYGADKLGCELHAHVGAVAYGIPSTGVRLFNVYGPRQYAHSPYSGVISIFCDRVKSGKEICIHGDGKQTRDFIYVGDAVRLLIEAMQSAPLGSAVYNGCTGIGTSIGSLAAEISRVAGVAPKITYEPPRRGHIRNSVGDPKRAMDRFNWKAEVSLAEGLRQILGVPQPESVVHDLGADQAPKRLWRRLF